MPRPQPLAVAHLGRADYAPTWALQRRIQQRLIAAKAKLHEAERSNRAAPPEEIPHVLLLVEHPHVFTLGKHGDRAHLLADDDALAACGAACIPVDRGGDITYHGPGQLVAYPILDLDRVFTDIHRYLRELEEAVIRTCADYGLAAGRIAGRTGVWIGPDARGPERKVCALGIRCSRWVTMHGLALNLNTDLAYFDHIVPCGIADRSVTSLAAELGGPVDAAEAGRRFLGHFAERFGMAPTFYDEADAHAVLERFCAAPAPHTPPRA